MADDDRLAAALTEERAILAAAAYAADRRAWRIATQVYGTLKVHALLKAVEDALKEHQPVNRGEDLEPICGTCHRGFWPCATHRAITVALAGEEAGDGN